jgi:hypothetical protein
VSGAARAKEDDLNSQKRNVSVASRRWSIECCCALKAIPERNYGKYIRDDGDAALRVLLEAQTETLTETFEVAGDAEHPQLPENVGATRRSRTGDLLITNQLLYQLS